jgi:pimeloyl-ACP methyl ester carboxylesterase
MSTSAVFAEPSISPPRRPTRTSSAKRLPEAQGRPLSCDSGSVTSRGAEPPPWVGACKVVTSVGSDGASLPTLIFVHGACVRDAPWWWSRMTEPLAGHGIASLAVPLPSCGETGDGLGDPYADVEATREAIAEAEAPVVLCGHSYGGMVITQAGADRRVSQLLYVTSVMPQAGQSLADLVGSQPTPWMDPGDDGTVGVHADVVRAVPPGLRRGHRAAGAGPPHTSVRDAVRTATATHRLAGAARDVLCLHRGPGHSRRTAATARQRPTDRLPLGPPPVPVQARGVRPEHRR